MIKFRRIAAFGAALAMTMSAGSGLVAEKNQTKARSGLIHSFPDLQQSFFISIIQQNTRRQISSADGCFYLRFIAIYFELLQISDFCRSPPYK